MQVGKDPNESVGHFRKVLRVEAKDGVCMYIYMRARASIDIHLEKRVSCNKVRLGTCVLFLVSGRIHFLYLLHPGSHVKLQKKSC